jgi:hypothetical protein
LDPWGEDVVKAFDTGPQSEEINAKKRGRS